MRLLERYSPFGADVLSDVHPGDYVYMRINDSRRIGSGFDDPEISRAVYFLRGQDLSLEAFCKSMWCEVCTARRQASLILRLS